MYGKSLYSVITVEPDIYDQLAMISIEMCLQITGKNVPDPDE